jgi:hypothetical protein
VTRTRFPSELDGEQGKLRIAGEAEITAGDDIVESKVAVVDKGEQPHVVVIDDR